jgi:hypothetical protein
MERIAWFKTISPESILLVGKKALELNELFEKNHPVSPGFVVTSYAYKEFFSAVEEKITSILRRLDINNEQKLQDSANLIQKIILMEDLPKKTDDAIREAYNKMDIPITVGGKNSNLAQLLSTTQKAKVVVKSSPAAANPDSVAIGTFPTYQNVEGVEQLKRAVKACWASLFTLDSIKYRMQNNFSHTEIYNPVIVQKMVQSEKSAVAFTVNPATGNRNEVVIEAIRGYSAGFSEFIPSTYTLEKDTNTIIKRNEVLQQFGYFGAEKGRSSKKELSYTVTSQPVLTDLEIIRITNISRELEAEFGRPVRIEFGVEGERAFINEVKQLKEQSAQPVEQKNNEMKQFKYKEDEKETEEVEETAEEEFSEEAQEENAESTEEKSEEPEEEFAENQNQESEDEFSETGPEEESAEDELNRETPAEEESDFPEQAESEETEAEEFTSKQLEEEESDEESAEETAQEETADEEFSSADEAETEENEAEDDKKEQKLNALFEDYSAKINQLLSELKDEALRILKY